MSSLPMEASKILNMFEFLPSVCPDLTSHLCFCLRNPRLLYILHRIHFCWLSFYWNVRNTLQDRKVHNFLLSLSTFLHQLTTKTSKRKRPLQSHQPAQQMMISWWWKLSSGKCSDEWGECAEGYKPTTYSVAASGAVQSISHFNFTDTNSSLCTSCTVSVSASEERERKNDIVDINRKGGGRLTELDTNWTYNPVKLKAMDACISPLLLCTT